MYKLITLILAVCMMASVSAQTTKYKVLSVGIFTDTITVLPPQKDVKEHYFTEIKEGTVHKWVETRGTNNMYFKVDSVYITGNSTTYICSYNANPPGKILLYTTITKGIDIINIFYYHSKGAVQLLCLKVNP